MDHDQAVEMQASIKYALGELTAEDRDVFEEHFADCAHCMNDVEAAAAFAANTRALLRERAAPKLVEVPERRADDRPKRFAWLFWRPALAFSAALNLVLVAGVGYAVLRHRAAPGEAGNSPELVEFASVHGTTRGSAQVVRTAGRPVVLSFDLPEHYDRYEYSVSQAGASVLSGEVSAPRNGDSLNLEIPVARLKPGEYDVALTGKAGAKEDGIGSCRLVVDPR